MIEKRGSFKKFFIFLFILLIILVIFFFGAKILVYGRFFLGNDILVKLNADQQNLFLKNGDQETITFSSSVTTNPLCKNTCESQLISIKDGQILYSENFSLTSSIPVKKNYLFSADGEGKGLDLYRFDLKCHNIYSDLCHTGEEPVLRSILITVNRDLNIKEKSVKLDDKSELSGRINSINEINNKLNYFNLGLFEISKSSNVINLKKSLDGLEKNIFINVDSINSLKSNWNNQEFNKLSQNLESTRYNFSNFELVFNKTKIEFDSNFSLYNQMAKNLTQLSFTLYALQNNSQYISNETTISEINSLITEFNLYVINNFNSSLDEKKASLSIINSHLSSVLLNANEEISSKIPSNKSWTMNQVYILNVNPLNNSLSNITIINNLEEPYGVCCVFNSCTPCCETTECSEAKENYPVIFIHGHDFSKTASADYSFESFRAIQQELENEDYINAGTISLYSDPNEPTGVWSQITKPISLRVSYYYDYFKDPSNPIIIQTKTENIDTYAIRLKDIIEEIKVKTNRPKINIVAHSMGGLVARRYIQLFGTGNVDNLILIVTPNKGIEGDVSRYCALFGEKLECADMDSNSLFMNKLNREGLPDIKVYNIVGVGCNMNGEEGDGIVLKRNVLLEGENITNIYINGSCSGVDLLHTEILKTRKYKETYEIVKSILTNKTNELQTIS
ncbi:MAG: alpha/beta fold hydrolase [Nanoarchaeota archaeon]